MLTYADVCGQVIHVFFNVLVAVFANVFSETRDEFAEIFERRRQKCEVVKNEGSTSSTSGEEVETASVLEPPLHTSSPEKKKANESTEAAESPDKNPGTNEQMYKLTLLAGEQIYKLTLNRYTN
jgi:hypothetical protein